MKHTPGPWAIDSELPPNPRSVIARTCPESSAELGIAISANTVGPHDAAENQANARLIAAAPTMLEALKNVRDWLLSQASTRDDTYYTDALKRCGITNAIAQAKGG